jgi:hypothetical protein
VTRRRPDDGLRAVVRAHLPMVQWTTVETGATQGGVPDLEGCYRGAQAWVECKATSGWAVKFSSPEQVGWHLRRAREGGVSWVLVRRRHAGGPRRGPPVDQLWVVRGGEVGVLARNGLQGAGQCLGDGGPSRWDWDLVLRLLLSAQQDHRSVTDAAPGPIPL